MEYILWCDESIQQGELYSNFYGGALVESTNITEVVDRLEEKKATQNLFRELKWTKITENYEYKYTEILNLYFELIRKGKIKVRIMFRDNAVRPLVLTKQQREDGYFLLYYQFVKHAFGFTKVTHPENTKLRINFDKIPDKREKSERFKSYILNLNKYFQQSNVVIRRDGISEVVSHDHVVLQCLDIVLGAMAFRLNKQHLKKPVGARNRGKKTRAKERVYKHISSHIRSLYPGYSFNIGISTGRRDGDCSHWTMPYRHWRFTAKKSVYDASLKK